MRQAYEYQRGLTYLASIRVLSRSWEMPYFCAGSLGYWALHGRPLQCLLQSGLLSNTSVNCNKHQQDGQLRIVLRYWCRLTYFTSRGEVIIWILLPFPAHTRDTPALLWFLALASSSSLRRSWYATCDWLRLHPTISHYFPRAQLRLALKSILIWFQLPKPCRCLYWDHTSSLASETIRLNSWPTPTRELPWLQLLSRRAYKFQLTVGCSVGDARVVHTTLWGTHVFCLISCVVLLYSFQYGFPIYVHHHHYR